MEFKSFDPGKILFLGILFLLVLCVHGDDDEDGYECSYLEPIIGRSGWFSIEQKYCDYGCCGDLYEQKCCTKEEIDHRRWVIGIAVVGGLLAIAIIVIIVLCIIKKKNMERAKIYTGDRPAAPRQGGTSFLDLDQTATSPPPPYTPGKYGIFTVNGHAGQAGGHTSGNQHLGPSAPPDLFIVQTTTTTSVPPPYNALERTSA